MTGEGNGNPLQYSHLGNPMDRGAWQAIVHGVAKESDTTERLNQQRNEEETGKEMTSFHILNKPNLILIGEGGLIHSRSDVMANE